jgi:hypothetical protein
MNTQTRFLAVGAGLGLLIAIYVSHWREALFAHTPGTAAEGIWLDAMSRALVLGSPLNFAIMLIIEPVSAATTALGFDPFYVLLGGIVANWVMIAWCLSYLSRKYRGR